MILFYINTQKLKQAKFVRYLFRSYEGEKQAVATSKLNLNDPLLTKANLVVFTGIIRGEGLIYKYCLENNKNFLYIDHAYLERGYNPQSSQNEWTRITPNAFNWSSNYFELDDRWNGYFSQKYPLLPWNSNDGKKILVLPPSEATKAIFPESVSWMEKTIDEIKKRTNFPIYIREKPLQPVVDLTTNRVTGRLNFEHPNSIDQDMQEAKCIVTFNSAVPVTGIIRGIPCYCSSHAAAYPMNINLDEIGNPREPDRQNWLNQLVYHQYTSEELKNGTFWKIITKYQSLNFNK